MNSSSVPLQNLTLPQLNGLKEQLDKEIELFSVSLDQLKLAQRKFQVCKDSLVDLEKATSSVSIREEGGSETVTGAEILVPLTSSVYVRGKLLAKNGKVLVDIGTGYFVEKSLTDGQAYYAKKVKFIGDQIEELQRNLMLKQETFLAIVNQMQLKIAEQQGSQAQTAA